MQNPTSLDPPELATVARHYLGVLQRRWWLVASLVAACSIASAGYLALTKPLYKAVARILIVRNEARSLGGTRDGSARNLEAPEDFIPTQMAILESPSIVSRAISAVGPGGLPTLASGGVAPSESDLIYNAIKKYLRVTRPDKSALAVSVEYRAGSPGEAIRFVNGLIAAYRQFLEDSYRDGNEEGISLLTKARDELSSELRMMQSMYREFQQAYPHLLDAIRDEAERPMPGNRLVELERAATETSLKELKLKSQLELARKLSKQGTEMWSVAFAISQLGGESGAGLVAPTGPLQVTSSDYVHQLVREQQDLAARHGVGSSKVRELGEQIAEAERRASDSAVDLDRGKVRLLLSSLELSLGAVEELRSEIGRKYKEELEQSTKRLDDVTLGRELHANLKRQKALVANVDDQLRRAQLGGDAETIRARTIEPAFSPATPDQPRVGLTLGLALVAGLGLGVGAALAAEGLDDLIHSPAALLDLTGLELLGTVHRFTKDQLRVEGGSARLCDSMPRSLPAEDYKALRTRVEFLRRDARSQLILVTSPASGEGKSTTTSNLAISLAHAGRRVLLIDADLRRPTQHLIHELPLSPGLTDLLGVDLPFRRVVHESTTANLWLLAAGSEVPNPAELLSSPRLDAVLREARTGFDVIIFDSSPLLPVTDALILSAIVDAVVLVVEGSRIREREVVRATTMLRSVRATVLGILVNGFDFGARRRDYYPYESTESPAPGKSALGSVPPGGGLMALRNGTNH